MLTFSAYKSHTPTHTYTHTHTHTYTHTHMHTHACTTHTHAHTRMHNTHTRTHTHTHTHTHTQGLGLLINMSEHSAQNRTQLQSTRIDDHLTESSQETANKEEEDIRMMQDDVMGCHGNRSSMKALIRLFLKHHAKSEQVSIEVCGCGCVWGGIQI